MHLIARVVLIGLGAIAVGIAGFRLEATHSGSTTQQLLLETSLSREYFESRHDHVLAELLLEGKGNEALKIAQLRYYSRVLHVGEMLEHQPNAALQTEWLATWDKARKLKEKYPFDFDNTEYRSRWRALEEMRR